MESVLGNINFILMMFWYTFFFYNIYYFSKAVYTFYYNIIQTYIYTGHVIADINSIIVEMRKYN